METAALADVGLRTAVASLVTMTVAPLALRPGRLRSESELLEFYADLADDGDATRTFPAPDGPCRVHATPVAPLPLSRRRGRVELLRFESAFEPLHPEMRDRYARHRHNTTAVAQHWRHADGPRNTLIVVHGFMGDPYWLNSAFFSLPWFYRKGYDVLLFTMPFHGRRQSRLAPYSGYGFFANGIAHINEAMAHAVHDLRVFIDHLRSIGVAKIGITGLSLGGYTAALLAAIEPSLWFSIPNAAVTHMPSLIKQWFPAGALMSAVMPRRGVPMDSFEQALAVHSPLSYPAALRKERLFIIAGLGDRLAPPEQSERLWEHWERPKMHWFPGNHVLHVNRGAYLKEMGRFMQSVHFDD
jgi:pimeloyl-ACP methyl ester carboxylesterase